MPFDGSQRVSGAGGVVPAALAVHRAHHEAVALEQRDQEPPHTRIRARSSAESSSRARTALGACAASGRARTTTQAPTGRRSRRSRSRCRSRRRTTLRATAPPSDRPTTKPARTGWGPMVASVPDDARCTTNRGRATRTPRRTVARKSADRRIRCSELSTSHRPRMCAVRTSACSGGEVRAALAPAGGEDGTAGARTHTQPEAVGLGATAVVRLEGALAHVQAPESREEGDRLCRRHPGTSPWACQKEPSSDRFTVRGSGRPGQTAKHLAWELDEHRSLAPDQPSLW